MSTKINILANLGGRLWAALMSFCFVPFYLHFLGIEAYGLIGFFVALLAVFSVLDMGLSTAVNRELARLDAHTDAMGKARTLLRTLEMIYWLVGAAITIGIVVAAPLIARNWLNVQTLPIDETTRAIQLMGATVLLRWPASLYTGALMGMRRQVRLNLIAAAGAVLQGGGAVLVLWLVSPTISAFFTWQILAAAVQILLLMWASWHHLAHPKHSARFSSSVLRGIFRFSAGVAAISLLSVLLTQLDKFVLSSLLPLQQFGYYSLSAAIAMVLLTAAGGIYAAVFPALTHLAEAGRERELSGLYHKSAQLMSSLLIPAGAALALFAPELLTAYIRNPEVVANTHLLLSLLAVGNTMLAMMMLPLALQLAFGWVRLSLYKNIIAVIIFVPSLLVMVGQFGSVGAALVWNMLIAGYFLVEIQVMHRQLLPGEQWRWYLVDVGVPAAISVAVMGGARLLVSSDWSLLAAIGACAAAAAVTVILCVIALPALRNWAIDALTQPKCRAGISA